MTHVPATEPIPERPSWPLLGHALDIPSGVDGLLHVMAEAVPIVAAEVSSP